MSRCFVCSTGAPPDPMSPLTRLYLGFSQFSDPIWRSVLSRRLKKGKELPERIGEKSGVSPVKRPAGEVIWFPALSVGESLALIPLIEKALADRIPHLDALDEEALEAHRQALCNLKVRITSRGR